MTHDVITERTVIKYIVKCLIVVILFNLRISLN
jgi:hypothetical protein